MVKSCRILWHMICSLQWTVYLVVQNLENSPYFIVKLLNVSLMTQNIFKLLKNISNIWIETSSKTEIFVSLFIAICDLEPWIQENTNLIFRIFDGLIDQQKQGREGWFSYWGLPISIPTLDFSSCILKTFKSKKKYVQTRKWLLKLYCSKSLDIAFKLWILQDQISAKTLDQSGWKGFYF